jgi:hypothetical protein
LTIGLASPTQFLGFAVCLCFYSGRGSLPQLGYPLRDFQTTKKATDRLPCNQLLF